MIVVAASDTGLIVFSYVSKLATDLPPAALYRLAEIVRTYNERHGLTGMLSLSGREVTQIVEGPWEIVMPLAARIITDRRHGNIQIQAFDALPARQHDGWTSSGFGDDEVHEAERAASRHQLVFLGIAQSEGPRISRRSATKVVQFKR